MARIITEADMEAARRLKAIFEKQKYGPERLTQIKLQEMMGFKQQVTVSQYLNGKIALGIEATAKFAKVLNVDPVDIREDFYDILPIKNIKSDLKSIPVRCTFTGSSPTQVAVKVHIGDKSTVGMYAVEINTALFNRSLIREGAVLVVEEDMELERGDDVYIELADETKTVGRYIGVDHADNTYQIACYATDSTREIPMDEVKKIDLIHSVKNPERKRRKRGE